MEQENARSLKEMQQGEGEVREEELKGVVGGTESEMRVDVPLLSIVPVPTLTMDEPGVEFDMEGKPQKNLF